MTATSQMKTMASSSASNEKKKLQPGKAYKVKKPAQPSSASTKMKNMAASCGACHG